MNFYNSLNPEAEMLPGFCMSLAFCTYARAGVMCVYCAWDELLSVLPVRIRGEVSSFQNKGLQELRLRINAPIEYAFGHISSWSDIIVKQDDLDFCINSSCKYSPWNLATLASGYITAPGGHRIGVCGEATVKNGVFAGIRKITSLCIRIARDVPNCSGNMDYSGKSILILGAPGWGKTTLLRDVSRKLAEKEHICVVDEREELFPREMPAGKKMDILSGCPKVQGIEILLRTMRPDIIAVDEITAHEDCEALIKAAGCGVRLLATAHASGRDDYLRRTVYDALRKYTVFDTLLILHSDKTFHMEEAG